MSAYCTSQIIFFLFLLSMPPLKGETVDPISEVDPETIFCHPYGCLPELHQPDYLLLFLLQYLLLLLLPHAGPNIRCHDWWETLRQQFDDGLLLLLLLGPGKKTTATHQHLRLGWIHHPPPSTLPHKSTQSATLPASNLVVGLLSGKKGKKSD